MSFSPRVNFDATLRYVGALPDPSLPHYFDLNARLGWQITKAVEFSVIGSNLLHARHYEFPASQGGEAIARSVLAAARWKF
jgi:iron complex outermembrane receptor protein